MGNIWSRSYDSPFSVSKELEDEMARREWDKVLDEWPNTVTVDVGTETTRNRFNNKYTINLDTGLLRDCRMCLLFPTHPKEKYRTLWTSDYRDIIRLQKDIDVRLREARTTGRLVMGVAIGSMLYAMDGIEGSVYLLWAKHVNCTTVNQQEAVISENMPIFFEMDRMGSYRSIFVFPHPHDKATVRDYRMSCLDVKSCTIIEPFRLNLFCMEGDPRQEEDMHIPTMSESEAEKMATNKVDRLLVSMEVEKPPFPSSDDER